MKSKQTAQHPLKSKSFSFQSTSRAQYAYEQAVDIITNCFFMIGRDLVKISGNIVTVPDWFPFSPSVN